MIVAHAPDFLATVLPNYLGSVGSILAAAIAGVALYKTDRTRRSTVQISNLTPPTTQQPHPARTPNSASPTFDVIQLGSTTVAQNITDQVVTVTSVSVVTEPAHLTRLPPLPIALNTGEGVTMIVHHVLGGPAIVAIDIRYEIHGTPSTARIFA